MGAAKMKSKWGFTILKIDFAAPLLRRDGCIQTRHDIISLIYLGGPPRSYHRSSEYLCRSFALLLSGFAGLSLRALPTARR